MSNLTIAYMTNRKDCCIQWFYDSLARELATHGDGLTVKIVVVDYWRGEFPAGTERQRQMLLSTGELSRAKEQNRDSFKISKLEWVSPKPCVWQGPHRLTKEDWFAASNARNTALCYADDGFIAYVDDLSVLMPGWLNSIREAMASNYIVCGAYRKVKELVVANGDVASYKPHSDDNRLAHVKADVNPCGGNWLYGCSVAGPVEAFLSVNGWPEFVDGLGFEDCLMGLCLTNAGYQLAYDRRMMTLESEEHHHSGPVFKKTDKGVSPNDKSHAALNIAMKSKSFPNYFGGEGIRGLRRRILSGEPFPVMTIPQHDWFDGQLISEM